LCLHKPVCVIPEETGFFQGIGNDFEVYEQIFKCHEDGCRIWSRTKAGRQANVV
jgi:hypothetical protein